MRIRWRTLGATLWLAILAGADATHAQSATELANSNTTSFGCSDVDYHPSAQDSRAGDPGAFSAASLTDRAYACRARDLGATSKPERELYASSLPDAPAPSDASASAFPDAPRANASDAAGDKYEPITGGERVKWTLLSTFGFASLAGGVVSSAYGTAVDHPHEYGPHWDGFGNRYGMRLSGVITSNAMEAGLGAIWGEDPRYFREPEKSLGGRVGSLITQTVMARHRDGDYQVAYARIMAVTGSNFLTNAWRVNSEADASHAMIRTAEGFGGRMAGNAWREFWPSIRHWSWHQ